MYEELKAHVQAAFKTLRKQGFSCRSNFQCCQGCAWAALGGKFPKAVFWHRQDTDHAKRDGTLFLAWSGDGAEIAKALTTAGLFVKWDGSESTRIQVSLFPGKN